MICKQRKKMSDEERKPHTFAFTTEVANPTAFLAEMLLQVRASVEALAIITIEELAGDSEEKGVKLAKHYESLREQMLLEHAFRLQDKPNDKSDVP
jgi:hypothetical protein